MPPHLYKHYFYRTKIILTKMGNIHPLSRIINNFADLNTFEFTSIIIIIHTYGNSDYHISGLNKTLKYRPIFFVFLQ